MNTRAAWAKPVHKRPLRVLLRTVFCAAASLVSCSLVTLGLLTAAAGAGAAQTAAVTSSTNFLQTAGGRRLGAMLPGSVVQLTGRTSGNWSEVVVEGWVWNGSVARTTRDGFDLVVSVAGGENFRDGPSTSGAIVARLLQGFLLEKVGESGRWSRARRSGWIASSALRADVADAGGGPGGEVDPGAGSSGDAEARAGTSGRAGTAGPAGTDDHLIVRGTAARLHISPDGDTVAVLRPGADLTVLGREGAWARVRLNGWVRVADLLPPDSAIGVQVSAADLRANPEDFRGRQIRWSVQFVSLERAEAVRTDFYEGEPFILARAPDPTDGFVYLAVPPELLPAAEDLQPLELIEVLARVRTGRSAIMGVPLLDLLAFF